MIHPVRYLENQSVTWRLYADWECIGARMPLCSPRHGRGWRIGIGAARLSSSFAEELLDDVRMRLE